MEKLNLLTADMLDILFEYRNKLYGAYELRRSYSKRITYAIGGTVLICLLFVAGTILANGGDKSRPADIATTIELIDYKEEKKPEPPLPPPPPKMEPPKIAMTHFTPPVIVEDDEVKPEDEIQDMKILEDTRIGTATIDGDKDPGIVAPPVEKSTGISDEPKVALDIDKPFTTVQIEARFTGGQDAWAKFLRKNLNSELPAEQGAPPADYKVIVSFIVDRNGFISDVRAENDPGYGTAAEAIRVIRKSPNWTPAVQNGLNVIYRQKQTITFQVREE